MPNALSTDQFSLGRFRLHGRVEYEDKGKLLWARAYGPFNRELMAAVLDMAKITFPLMATQGPWAHICIFQESALCSPDVLGDLADSLRQMAQAGVAPSVMAFVMPLDVEGSSLMAPLYERALGELGVPFRCFVESNEALSWTTIFVDQLGLESAG